MNLHRTKKNKFILTTSCTLLAVITAGVAVMSATQTALARATLPGVEKIIEDNGTDNPFVILEIVPEKEDASLGFLVAGEEPVDDTAKSIKDMPSKEERSARFADETAINDKINALGIGNAVGFSAYDEPENVTDDTVKTVDIRGVFAQSESEPPSGDYALRDATAQYDTITVVEEDKETLEAGEYKPSQLLDLELYRRHMTFRPAGEGNDGTKYAVKLEPLGDTTDLPVKFVKDVNAELFTENSPVIDAYNHQYFVVERDVEIITKDVVNEETGETESVVDTEAMAGYMGEMIFLESQDGSLSYIGVLTNTRQAMLMFARPPVREEETETGTVSENEITTETETTTESTMETETESTTETTTESTTETTTEPTTPETTTEPTTTEPTTPETTTEPTTTEPTTPETTTTETEPPTTPTPPAEEIDEPSNEDLSIDDQARAFTTKKMYRMSVTLDDIVGGIDGGYQYVVVKEADGSDSDAEVLYYIDSVAENEDADLVANENYNRFLLPDTQEARNELVGETFYVRKDNILPYEYKDDNSGTHTFTADYTQDIYDTVSYTGGFTNEEWFKKYVFDLDDSELADMCIDVVTVTWKELMADSELAEELLDKADLIYFADPANKGFMAGDTPDTTDEWIVQFDFDDADGYKDGGITAAGDVGDSNGVANFSGWNQFLTVDGLLNNSVTGFSVSFTMNTTKGEKNWPFFLPYDIGTAPTYLTEKYLGAVVGWDNGTYRLLAERYNMNGESSRPTCAQAQVPSGTNADISVYYGPDSTTIYVDGQQRRSEGSTVALSSILSTEDAKPFWIGKSSWTGGEYYQGTLDNYVISSAATPDEISVLQQKTIDNADSIYNAIVKKAAEGLPVVLNRSLYSGTNNDMAVRKMAACLMRDDILSVFGNDGADGRAVETMSLTGLTSSMHEGNAFVAGNVFVYDDTQAGVVSDKFADKNFYSDDQIASGFSDVVTEIENENFYLELAGKEDRISEDVTMATAIRHIINHEDKRIVTKTSLRVLDLEPYDFERYYEDGDGSGRLDVYEDIKSPYGDGSIDSKQIQKIETDSICITADGKLDKEAWIVKNLAPQLEGKPNQLDVTIMGTKEFVGKLNDLNAEYDLIYLGMDTSIMNTEIDNNTKTDNTVYNNSAMNGLVYTHIGDSIGVKTAPAYEAKLNGTYCLSGNDITADKLRELREYIEAGYAVVLSDEMLEEQNGKYSVNTKKIDINSNMYTLIHDTVLKEDGGGYKYFGKNVNRKSTLESSNSAKETFNKYLGISKLVITPLDGGLPTEYNQPGGGQGYLSADSNGVYWLKYDVSLTDDAAVGPTSTTYDCQLYVDIDADGRYEEGEMLSGLTITDDSGAVYGMDSAGRYHLSAGNVYHISRDVPNDYTGFLAWKLMFTQNDRTYSDAGETAVVRSAITGFSAVPCMGVRPEIRVLQITSVEGTTNLDLDSEEMHLLYAGVQDFTINVTKMTSSDYIGKVAFPEMTHEEYLNGFDMVVMGFRDVYRFGSKWYGGEMYDESMIIDATLAIREYALSGRSIMFTHDLNSSVIDDTTNKEWGYYFNTYLRDIQGMDRFGEVAASGVIADEKLKYNSLYDNFSLSGFLDGKESKSVTKALVNPVIISGEYKSDIARNTFGENARRASWHYSFFWNYKENQNGWEGDYVYNSHVEQVNKGQITEYPYKIAEEFEITQSHPQYFQLNLDTDNRDTNDNDDIVVWYTLGHIPGWSDSYFASNEKDVRNNYFIYNKGNVTYTGSGDRTITSDMERKLFVNTLVASYRAGMQAPRALYKESTWQNSATITSKYIPYDPNVVNVEGTENETGALLDNLEVHFYTTNPNLKKSNETLYAKYYIEVTASAQYDLHTNGKYYKEIQPDKMYRIIAQDNAGVPEAITDVSRLSNNTMYTAEFSYSDVGFATAQDIRKDYTADLYVRLSYEPFGDAQDGAEVSLSAAESMSRLEVVCVQLFELK